MICISFGAGRMRPQGETVELEDVSPIGAVATAIESIAPTSEGWFSPHVWRGSYRNEAGWISSSGVTIDIDFKYVKSTKWTRTAPELIREPDGRDVDMLVALRAAMPGNLFYLTPHGARVLFVFAEQCSDREAVYTACRGACALIAKVIEGTNHFVDESTSCDLARFFYTPNAHAKGVQREAVIVPLSRREPYEASELGKHVPVDTRDTVVVPPPRVNASEDYAGAVEKFNADHPLDVDRHSGRCPICDHYGCFGRLPNDAQRWFCWSTNHDGIGVKSPRGWHGDALDLYAYENGVKPLDVLLKLGYLKPKAKAKPATITNIGEKRRPIKNNSYLSVLTIIKGENDGDPKARGVLGGRKIRRNEMTGLIEFGDRELKDSDIPTVRAEIERTWPGSVDDNGNEVGLKVSKTDVDDAVRQVAEETSYHPVRDYLNGLQWDGVDRLDFVASEILGAEDTLINRALVRKFFVSAAARAMEPGCKVDSMLIIVGDQGALKSTFFRVISSPWFNDTAIDINKTPDCYQLLRRAWITEWAELESIARARDADAVKAYISSPADTYRNSYGRNPETVRRSGVVVGSTNHEEFLNDPTGARRFWVIVIPLGVRVKIEIAREQRDQLWAEATAIYRQWVERGRLDEDFPWWLSPDESRELTGSQEKHRVNDPWEEFLQTWANGKADPFTTSEALKAIGKDREHWTDRDQKRVNSILRSIGFAKKSTGKDRVKRWTAK